MGDRSYFHAHAAVCNCAVKEKKSMKRKQRHEWKRGEEEIWERETYTGR